MASRARAFEDARRFVHGLGLDTPAAWYAWAQSDQRPTDIPRHPRKAYRWRGWAGWQDWLGTEKTISNGRAFRPFEDARAFARSLGLQTGAQWQAWLKSGACPADIPRRPWHFYRGSGWIHMGDWLGTALPSHQHRSRAFDEARRFARGLGLRGARAWFHWSASGLRPADIPFHPERAYATQGWAGGGDFLGTQRVADQARTFRPFAEARAYVHTLGLKTQAQWKVWRRSEARPSDIPTSPEITYRQAGWTHWGDWLGNGRSARRRRGRRPSARP